MVIDDYRGAMMMNRLGLIRILLCISMALTGAWAGTQSVNIAVIGSGPVINGGFVPTSGPDLPGMTFTNLAPGSVTAAALAPFDTVILNVASAQMACNVNTLSAAAQADLVAFVASGHKLIIVDSECSPQNYSWLPFPFQTNNPGAAGANGTATIIEENVLSSSNPASPFFINVTLLSAAAEVGDANVMTTFDSHWCVDMSATNINNVTGPVHTYAKVGGDIGLIIYNGFDTDAMTASPGVTGPGYLRKLFVQELLAPFNPSSLPCGTPVVPRFYATSYAANLNVADSFVNITNSGARGADLAAGTTAATTGAICVNVYAFSPDEQMVACCSCPVTPNGLVSLSAKTDLISNTLTPAVPTSITIKLLASTPVGNSCANSAASPGALAPGMHAWNTTLHQGTSGYGVQETPFSFGTLSQGELTRLTQLCTFIKANGSGFGVCKSCRIGGLAGAKQ
jgi:hypothetical protein